MSFDDKAEPPMFHFGQRLPVSACSDCCSKVDEVASLSIVELAWVVSSETRFPVKKPLSDDQKTASIDWSSFAFAGSPPKSDVVLKKPH